MTEPKKQIDWEAVELEYRAGIRSLKAIGSQFGVTDAGIIKRAKRDGWERDLKARIQAATEAKLIAYEEEQRRAKIQAEELAVEQAEVSARREVSEVEIVDANSDTQLDVILETRKDIQRAANLVGRLMGELEETTDNRVLFTELGDLLRKPDDKNMDKLNDIYHKAVSMPSRVSAMKSLTDALKTLIGLKRQAYGLADNANGEADKPEQQTEISDTEAARRVAFMFAKAMRKQETI